MRWIVSLLLIFMFDLCQALEIPSHLSVDDRRSLVRMLGMSTSAKVLGSPYPLGGYSGFEASVSLEIIDTSELASLGCAPGTGGCPNTRRSDERELRYSRLSFGKGLFHNVDLYVHFIPPQSGLEISDYAGTMRWSFFEAKFAPINLTFLTHLSQIDVAQAFVGQTIGTEVVAGITVDDLCLYFGGGMLRTRGRFLGGSGPNSVLDPADPALRRDSNTISEVVTGSHSVIGVSLQFSGLFAAAQIDRYRDPVFSAKLGIRY